MPTDAETADAVRRLDEQLAGVEGVLDLDARRAELAELDRQASDPALWEDQTRAQKVTRRMATVRNDLERIDGLRSRVEDLAVLLELAGEEDDDATRVEAATEVGALTAEISKLETRTLLSGEYDDRPAVITVQAQAGGVDAADFTEMLVRMYTRWAERHDHPVEVLDTSYAEEAGLKSATFTVRAPYAYGTLHGEHGVHRLVRISPFDNQGRRQTSFAGVDVVPEVESDDEVDIPEADIRVDVFRSSGPGGQSVNTTDSAVRITHLPTNVVVSCQNEKSQIQNRAAAMRVLASRLLERRRQEEEAKMNAIRGEAQSSWGNQIRNYVLHPYQMVKDTRTGHEIGDTQGVLDGDIDDLLDAEIRWRRAQQGAST